MLSTFSILSTKNLIYITQTVADVSDKFMVDLNISHAH